jgi:site-specific DNA recombinase
MVSKKAKKQPLQVVGYIRVSTAMQVNDGESLERQEEQIRAFCLRKGIAESDLQIVADKGVSGFKSNRPGFQKLIKLCTSKQVKMVVVYDLSRLSRSVRDTLGFVEDVIQKHGIEFASIQNDIDTSSPMGKAFLGFNAIFNQLYRDEIAFKTKAALTHKRSKGEKTGGVVPFGFILVGDTRLAAAPGEIQTIAYIHSLRERGMSLREIVAELYSKGIKTKTGKEKWNPKVVRGILERQITQVTHDPELTNSAKDQLLQDVAGALYDAEALAELEEAEAVEVSTG